MAISVPVTAWNSRLVETVRGTASLAPACGRPKVMIGGITHETAASCDVTLNTQTLQYAFKTKAGFKSITLHSPHPSVVRKSGNRILPHGLECTCEEETSRGVQSRGRPNHINVKKPRPVELH
ncbi:hypothetical protein RRG08_031072 [Elysia crispata]|uniref:Uncharacterized protein n=1 Tax=Elysia crispata TaxID=231223 RepID=A0AAE0ZFK7_9GAST|nr:hypothetical protein RRG08_031072 [Elysia crispata]